MQPADPVAQPALCPLPSQPTPHHQLPASNQSRLHKLRDIYFLFCYSPVKAKKPLELNKNQRTFIGPEQKYDTVCPGGSDPFYIVSYYIKWVTTSWTHGTIRPGSQIFIYSLVTTYKWARLLGPTERNYYREEMENSG